MCEQWIKYEREHTHKKNTHKKKTQKKKQTKITCAPNELSAV